MNIDDLINDCVNDSQDTPTGKKERGRPNKGLTKYNRKLRHDDEKKLRELNTKQSPVERVRGEVVDNTDVKQFLELYETTVESVKEQYFSEHPDNLKRPPHEWIEQLLYTLKDNLPSIDKNNITIVGGVWEIFRRLMASVKLFPTIQAFTDLTGIYKQTLDNRLTPEWINLVQKMMNDCESGLYKQVAFNPNTQINKLFLLKSVYGYKEADTQKTIEVNHTIKKVNDIPLFGIESNGDT